MKSVSYYFFYGNIGNLKEQIDETNNGIHLFYLSSAWGEVPFSLLPPGLILPPFAVFLFFFYAGLEMVLVAADLLAMGFETVVLVRRLGLLRGGAFYRWSLPIASIFS